MSSAAWAFGLARPYSQFSKVRSLVRKYRANTARDRLSFARMRTSSFAVTVEAGLLSVDHAKAAARPRVTR